VTADLEHASRIDLAVDGTTWWLHLNGYLDEAAVRRLDDALQALQGQPELPTVVWLCSSRYTAGALAGLRQTLRRHQRRRTSMAPLTVWADEPIIREALPAALRFPPPAPTPPASRDAMTPDAHDAGSLRRVST
jgi:hypothetical protein